MRPTRSERWDQTRRRESETRIFNDTFRDWDTRKHPALHSRWQFSFIPESTNIRIYPMRIERRKDIKEIVAIRSRGCSREGRAVCCSYHFAIRKISFFKRRECSFMEREKSPEKQNAPWYSIFRLGSNPRSCRYSSDRQSETIESGKADRWKLRRGIITRPRSYPVEERWKLRIEVVATRLE